MGFRYYSRKKIAPGVRLNMSKSGPSVTFGPKGLRYTVGPRGRRTTVGVPGTGLSYTSQSKKRSKRPTAPRHVPSGVRPSRRNEEWYRAQTRIIAEGLNAEGPLENQCTQLLQAGNYTGALRALDRLMGNTQGLQAQIRSLQPPPGYEQAQRYLEQGVRERAQGLGLMRAAVARAATEPGDAWVQQFVEGKEVFYNTPATFNMAATSVHGASTGPQPGKQAKGAPTEGTTAAGLGCLGTIVGVILLFTPLAPLGVLILVVGVAVWLYGGVRGNRAKARAREQEKVVGSSAGYVEAPYDPALTGATSPAMAREDTNSGAGMSMASEPGASVTSTRGGVACPYCGRAVTGDERYCSGCGTLLSGALPGH